MRDAENQIKNLQVTMPVTFDTKEEYILKLKELIDAETAIDQLRTEVIAEKDIEFEFEEILEIYCRMKLRVPKTNQAHIRE